VKGTAISHTVWSGWDKEVKYDGQPETSWPVLLFVWRKENCDMTYMVTKSQRKSAGCNTSGTFVRLFSSKLKVVNNFKKLLKLQYFKLPFPLFAQLTNSTEQGPSWEADWLSVSQEIPRILWDPKVHYPIHKCPPPVRSLSGPRFSLWTFRNVIRLYGEEVLAPRPTPTIEDHPLSAVRDCLFNISAATLHIGSHSSIRILRTRHTVTTGTHLSRLWATQSVIFLRVICVVNRFTIDQNWRLNIVEMSEMFITDYDALYVSLEQPLSRIKTLATTYPKFTLVFTWYASYFLRVRTEMDSFLKDSTVILQEYSFEFLLVL
jgi:hypothetical protein